MAAYIKAFSGLFKTKSKEIKSGRLTQIEGLKERLIKAGHHPDEVNYFMMSIIGSTPINKLDNQQLQVLKQGLENQLKIAEKCGQMVRK